MFPELSFAIPDGKSNWPGPVPNEPNVVKKLPDESNTSILLLFWSTTSKFPELSIAIPAGELREPGPVSPAIVGHMLLVNYYLCLYIFLFDCDQSQ